MNRPQSVLTRGRNSSSSLRIAVAAAAVALGAVGVSGREPAAYLDSEAAVIDTRIGTEGAIASLALDSRIGSWADSNLRGINTNPVGALFIFR